MTLHGSHGGTLELSNKGMAWSSLEILIWLPVVCMGGKAVR